MYKREIDILTTVFKGYVIYIEYYSDAISHFNNGVELNYDYIKFLEQTDIIKNIGYYGSHESNPPMRTFFLNHISLEENLKKIHKNILSYITDPVLHIYREEKITKIIQK